jgi:hypothetical protein|tara:strand:- start:2158 stop:2556 length:399 start_codon:yes stop_codon:yes gene_type:complete
MAIYHPPKMITNNAAPILSADLAYEGHGKCGCQTIILNDDIDDATEWSADEPQGQPVITGCTDYSHVYKIVALANTKFRQIRATNIATEHLDAFEFAATGFILKPDAEIMADFIHVDILSGFVMLYRDCEQS